jgi:hypothetical protein
VNHRLPKLNLPETDIKLKPEGKSIFIFDPIRKKWLNLTPEEWVRQNLIMFLHNQLHYPLSLMETEKQFKLFNTVKRADIILNNSNLNPLVIVECKAPDVKIDQNVFDQAIRYSMALDVNYLFISNGLKHYVVDLNNEKPVFLDHLPEYEKLIGNK